MSARLFVIRATLALASIGVTQAEAVDRPNILLIVADDLGWRDVGYHDSEIRTPHIDRLAREGVELDRFYVQPMCSPTRAGLMTGKSPMRLGITRAIAKIDETGLPRSEKILPQYLADAGYQRLMVGKWHLGHHTPDLFPQARGFEHFYGHVTGGIGYWDHNHGGGHDWQRNGETLREEGYTTHLITDEAIRLVEERDRARPLFLYVAFNAPHTPNEAPHEAIAKYEEIDDPGRRVHAAMVDELDQAIGRILSAFEREKMLENTIVFFTSDNGGLSPGLSSTPLRLLMQGIVAAYGERPLPTMLLEFLASMTLDGHSDNTPLPAGKGFVAEGGVRVPAAIWWPGHLERERFDGFMTISDVLPTILDAIGEEASTPDDLDGRSRWNALTGDGPPGDPPDYVTATLGSAPAIYRGRWKLVDPDAPRLYDIYADPYEERDVSTDKPEVVAALTERLNAWPRGEGPATSPLSLVLDIDVFGGSEDREPWADAAKRNARAARGN